MKTPMFDFEPTVFLKTLAITLGVVLLGWVGAIRIYGGLSRVDIAGSLISALIFAYMVHLWIVYGRDRERQE